MQRNHVILYSYSLIALILDLTLWLIIFFDKNKSIFRSTPTVLLHAQHLGCLICCIFTYFVIEEPKSIGMCHTRIWSFHLAIGMILGCNVIKIRRIYHMSKTVGYRISAVTTMQLILQLLLFLSFFIVYLLIVSFVGKIEYHSEPKHMCHLKYHQLVYGLGVVEILILIYILFLSWTVRNTSDVSLDTNNIAVAMSGMLLLFFCHGPFIFYGKLLSDYEQHDLGYSTVIATIWINLSTSGACLAQYINFDFIIPIVQLSTKGNQLRQVAPIRETNNRAGENENGLDKPDSRHRDKQLSDLWNPETNHFSNYAMDTSDENHKSVLRVCMEETKDAKLSILLDSIQTACKKIHKLTEQIFHDNLLDKVDAKNVFGKEQKGIDILANMFFHHALIDSNSCCLIVSSENVAPYIVPYEHAGPYCVAYYPLNGSSNLGCNISVGSIFGIWRRISDEDFLAKIDDILQSGNNLICSGYCMYSYSTEFIISYRTGLRKFQFDPLSMNFFLTSCHCKIMNPPQLYYSINEGNIHSCEPHIYRYLEALKVNASTRFSLRYVGSMVADFHRTLVYGGIYLYPADKIRSKGKLRYLYECAPLALLIEQAGGAAITCGYSTKTPERILDIVPYDIHQRCSIVAGCTRDIAMYRRSCVDLVISFSQDSFSSGSGSHHSSVISNMLYNQPRSSLDTVQKELEIRRSLHVEANDRKKQCNSKEDEYNNASDGLIIGGL